jgi:hypothetical protein
MAKHDLARIEAMLQTLTRLAALSLFSENASLRERALVLQRAGLAPKEIALLCDTTPNTISVALSAAKREKKSGRQRR